MKEIAIFVASPGDVRTERDLAEKVVDELNKTVARDHHLALRLVRWETHAVPELGRAQQAINRLLAKCDIFVGLMWRRFGMPTGVAESGTVEEFELALASWQQVGKPRVLFYFSQALAPPPATTADAKQQLQVAEFRERVQGVGLTSSYATPEAFEDALRVHLHRLLVDDFAVAGVPLAEDLLAALDGAKQRCRAANVEFFTPHLLLALLGRRGGITAEAVRAVYPDGADALYISLQNFAPPAGHRFRDFRWEEREDVQGAMRLARGEQADVTDERHLILAVLRRSGNTQRQLRSEMGAARYDQLCHWIERVRLSPQDGNVIAPHGTPPISPGQ